MPERHRGSTTLNTSTCGIARSRRIVSFDTALGKSLSASLVDAQDRH
jgi:hypothetical protein